ncbi:MAG: alpha/beta hydrolase [Pseudomonadales bacterium]|nr:alpha/beta hydrolase [Pseudomonadales bacterium]
MRFFQKSIIGLLNLLAYVSDRAALMILFKLMRPGRLGFSESEQEAVVQAQVINLDFNGDTLAGYCWGDDGPVVMLIHGAHSRSSHFFQFVSPMLAQGYRVIAFDLPAHGDSSGKSADVIQAIAAVRVALMYVFQQGDIDTVITHSLGFGLMQAAVQELGGEKPFKRVIAISCPENFDEVLSSLKRRFALPNKLVSVFRQYLEFNLEVSLKDFSLFSFMDNKNCSILFIHDENDSVFPNTPSLSGKIQGIPGASFISTQQLGHMRILTNVSVVEQCLSFMAEA